VLKPEHHSLGALYQGITHNHQVLNCA
jgi:hypothetical protein